MMSEQGASARQHSAFSRRNALRVAGAGIVTAALPTAGVASSVIEVAEVGTFSPILSSLATANETQRRSHRTSNRSTFTFATTGGGSISAMVWQFDPTHVESESRRLTPRISLHNQVPTNPSDATASQVGLLGVFEPEDATYDPVSDRITLVPAAPIALPAGTFYAQFYGVSSDEVSTLWTKRTPDPWVASVSGWTFEGLQVLPSYDWAPVTAFGTLA